MDTDNLELKFTPFAEKMRKEGLPDVVVRTFKHYYTQLLEGKTGEIPEAEIRPVQSLPDIETFPRELVKKGDLSLSETVMIKLNGGLGTSMGLEKAKSLLRVKDDLTFLDIIAQQAIHSEVELALMNSFVTQEDSLEALKKYPELWDREIEIDFLQHKVPKVSREDLSPVSWPKEPGLDWAPPGHGDIYTALVTSGMLDNLLEAGFRYAFVSNSDNLGAVMDSSILGYFAHHEIPFMMEVTERTEADKKGGHLAETHDGQLILRESAQCPPLDEDAFQDISRHRYFNTNNLWINLSALKALMETKDNILGLPLIRNEKTVDPRDSESTPVYQLETAMGAAIGVFENARAVRVPRNRFAPVKKTDDLLVIRSDAYELTEDFRIVPNPVREFKPPVIDLDPSYYKLIDEMEARFPHGAPSLLHCLSLSVQGDVIFGNHVVLKGEVEITNTTENQAAIREGTTISGRWNATE